MLAIDDKSENMKFIISIFLILINTSLHFGKYLNIKMKLKTELIISTPIVKIKKSFRNKVTKFKNILIKNNINY